MPPVDGGVSLKNGLKNGDPDAADCPLDPSGLLGWDLTRSDLSAASCGVAQGW